MRANTQGSSTEPTAAHVFARFADRVPNRPAVRYGETELTYAELADTAGGAAEWLRARGVGRGDIVATLLDRSHLCVVAVLAAWAVGAAYVHIEPTDPDARVRALLADVEPAAILTDARNADRIPADVRAVASLDEASPAPAAYRVSEAADVDDPAYLVFTSGSTGVPKMVEVAHRSLLNFRAGLWGCASGEEPFHSFGMLTTFAADLGNASIFGALLGGWRLDIYDRATTLDPRALAAELRAHPVDVVKITPSLLEALAGRGELAPLLPARLVLFGGEPLSPRLVRAIFAAAPGIEILNGYGPAEATVSVAAHRVTPADAAGERIPIGYPLPGITTRLLDERGRPVPDGEPGVLHLGGACLATGYRGDPEKTAAKFVLIDGERFYRTDDLVIRAADGRLDILGRADDQVKVRGYRVEPGEVAAALLRIPGVESALVVGERAAADAPVELAAYVVGGASRARIAAALAERLPAPMIPSRISHVPRIPVNANGKADLAALRASVAAPAAPEPAHAPVGTAESLVAEIWREVLGVPHVGRHERFAEVGGTSFKALAVYARLREHYPAFTIAQLYAHPTIAALTADLGGSAAEPAALQVVEL